MAYPTTIDTWTTKANNVDDVLASHVNDLQTAVRYVEAGVMWGNYVITPSVSSNNLTIALKTMAGTDPSATDPIIIKIGDTLYSITSAISFTANAGTNWMNSGASETAGADIDYFLYAINETGASAGVKIGMSRIPYATTMNNFSATTTNELYIKGSWTNKNATDKVAIIGRVNAILSSGAGFTWSLTTSAVINRPIYDTRWIAWTPTVGSSGGSITTLGSVISRYQVSYNKVFLVFNITVSNNGTGSGTLTTSMPFTPANVGYGFSGREVVISGKTVTGYGTGATVNWVNYDSTYPMANNATLYANGRTTLILG